MIRLFSLIPRNSVSQLLLLCLLPLMLHAQNNYETHTVKAGENLYRISLQYGTTVESIKEINNLTSNLIFVNQKLRIQPAVQEASRDLAQVSRSDEQFDGDLGALIDGYESESTESKAEQWWSDKDEEALSFENDWEWTPEDKEEASTGRRSRAYASRSLDQSETIMVEKKEYYEVERGDNIYSIADRYQKTVAELRAWNAIVEVQPGDVIVVDRYEVPASGSQMYGERSRDLRQARSSNTYSERPSSQTRGVRPSEPTREDHYKSYFDEATGYESSSNAPSKAVFSDRSDLGQWMESGRFTEHSFSGKGKSRYYALHPSLDPGTIIRIAIPENYGFLEAEVVGPLTVNDRSIIGLSPACVQVLRSAGAGDRLHFYYD